jgi:DMSO reductase family type II enzyme chaperone
MSVEPGERLESIGSPEIAIRQAQLYLFLSMAFLYPEENWLDGLPAVEKIVHDLNLPFPSLAHWDRDMPDLNADLNALQSEYRRVLGLTGSLCYETEYGLPHEFRHSQELADIAGFYNAFGFVTGGVMRERPDHIAVEFEFLYLLALKQAYALETGLDEQAEICADARRNFLHDHIGHWVGLFAESLARMAPDSVYTALARFAVTFVRADADHLGVQLETRQLASVRPTPLGPEMSCQDCVAAETLHQG